MKHLCAWCGVETAPPDGKDDHLISHGICAECKDKVLKGLNSGGNNKHGIR